LEVEQLMLPAAAPEDRTGLVAPPVKLRRRRTKAPGK